jgi:cytochrome P450
VNLFTAPSAIPRDFLSIRSDRPAPAHVPSGRVVDLQWATGRTPNDLVEPYQPFGWLLGADVPRILYDPTPGPLHPVGGWYVMHYEDIRRVYEEHETFSTVGVAEFQRMIGETFHSIPLAFDPPLHTRYRKFLNPHFTPVALKKMEASVRALAVEMIEEFADKGEVDIAYDFGRVYPVRIFMDLMGFPPAMFEQFLQWEYDILHSRDPVKTGDALKGVIAWLRGFIAERERVSDDKLVSKIVHGTIEGETLTADEKIGIVWFLWLGGLDTVASTISQMFRRLGQDQALQARLRTDPELINTAVEEFLRTQPLVNSSRTVVQDTEWHGITLKAGDQVFVLNSVGNFDPDQFADPRAFDPARGANRHFTFIGGAHICLGAPLARRELRCLLDEFLRRIPRFRIKPSADTTVNPGLLSIRNLPIVWDVPA